MENVKKDRTLDFSFYFLMFLITGSVVVFVGYIIYALLFA